MQDNKVLWVIITTILVVIFAYSLFFSRPSYIVTFDSSGGAAVNEQEISRNDSVTRPNDPVREGYNFVGWILNNEEFDFETPVTGAMTLVASWDAIILTVTFNSNGGTAVEDLEIAHGNALDRPSNPTRRNFRFVEWRLDGEAFDWDTPITEDIELVAHWRR